MLFTLAWQCAFCLQVTIFFHINIGKLVVPPNHYAKGDHIWLAAGHILEPRTTYFRGLKWGIDFSLSSEIGYGKLQIRAEIEHRLQGLGPGLGRKPPP